MEHLYPVISAYVKPYQTTSSALHSITPRPIWCSSTRTTLRPGECSFNLTRHNKSRLPLNPFPVLEFANEYLNASTLCHTCSKRSKCPTHPECSVRSKCPIRYTGPAYPVRSTRLTHPIPRKRVKLHSPHKIIPTPTPCPTSTSRTKRLIKKTVINEKKISEIEDERMDSFPILNFQSLRVAVGDASLTPAAMAIHGPRLSANQKTYVEPFSNASWHDEFDKRQCVNSPMSFDSSSDGSMFDDFPLNDSSSDVSLLDDCSLIVNLPLTKKECQKVPLRMPAHTKHGRIKQLQEVYRDEQKSVIPARKSSSYINRMKGQNEIKRKNKILVGKILKAKPTVCSFRR